MSNKKSIFQDGNETKRNYYWLPTDQYGQPRGDIITVSMTPSEYERQRRGAYLFDNYEAACYRAMD